MNKANITKPDESSGSALWATLLCLALALRHLRDMSEKTEFDWISALLFTAFISLGIYQALQWLRRRKTHWSLTWDKTRVKIQNEYAVAYEGDLSDMHLVDQDGRGYFFYITPKTVFRLRKGHSSEDFEATLDKIQEAQQVAASNGDKRPS